MLLLLLLLLLLFCVYWFDDEEEPDVKLGGNKVEEIEERTMDSIERGSFLDDIEFEEVKGRGGKGKGKVEVVN